MGVMHHPVLFLTPQSPSPKLVRELCKNVQAGTYSSSPADVISSTSHNS